MRAGALDFLVKPAAPERLKVSLANALKVGAPEGEIGRMRPNRAGTFGLRDIALDSPPMERVCRLAERAARSSIPLLIEGERGVGKELLARAVHGSSARRSRPFVALGCGSIRETLLESLLFGDGMDRKFLEANGATLYLDEIGGLPASAQERLVSFLWDGDSNAVAADRSQRADIRLIVASSRRLVELVSEGGFREDLFYRLSVMPIWLPPLRERRADIPILAHHVLARLAAEEGKSGITGISAEAIELLCKYHWPGNIRELEHTIFRAVVLCEGGELSLREFPQILVSPGCGDSRASVADQKHVASEQPPSSGPIADTRAAPRYGVTRLLDERGELRRFDALEEEAIRFAISHCRGRMSEVARRLGIGRSTLYRKIKDYGIVSGEVMVP